MGNYIKKEYSGQVNKTNDIRIVEKVVEKDVDIATLAEAMAKALLNHFPQGVQGQQVQYQSFKNILKNFKQPLKYYFFFEVKRVGISFIFIIE
jgi:hypothetical protein